MAWITSNIGWISPLITTSGFAVVLYLARNLIITRLTTSVKNEFDKKLETLKSDLRQKETQIEALRTGAMSGLLNRQSILYTKQLEAISQIWDAMFELSKAKYVSEMLTRIDIDVVKADTENKEKMKKFFELIGTGFDSKKINTNQAAKARPFLTELAWAYYSAYASIILSAVLTLEVCKAAPENAKLLKKNHANDLIKAALPHQTAYIDKYGESCYHFLLDEIETFLLTELRNIQKGTASDKENTEQAAKILKEADLLSQSSQAQNKSAAK